MRNIRLFIAWFKLGLIDSLNSRMETVIWAILRLMTLIPMLVLWPVVYNSGQNLNSYDLSQILMYYIGGQLLISFIENNFDTWVVDKIRRGELSQDLVKPVSVKFSILVRELSWRLLFFFIFTLPPTLIIARVMKLDFPINSQIIIILPLFIAIGFLISGIMNLFVAASAFIFEHASSLTQLRWVLTTAIGGSMVPIEFMPEWLQRIAQILPFKFLYFVPTQILMRSVSLREITFLVIQGGLWVTILVVGLNVYWNRALKSYTAVGN